VARDKQRRFAPHGILWRFALGVILLLTFFPFIFMLMTSLKDLPQFYHSFWTPQLPLHFDNYARAFADMRHYLINSILVTAASIAGILASSIVTGFLIARYRFPGRAVIFHLFLAIMMIPGVLMLVPSFSWAQRLGMLDTYWVMILPYIAGGQVVGIYLLRSFFAGMSSELFEAAQLDGAGLFRQLWHVAIPLAKPVIGVVAIISALSVWNQFLWPLVTTSSEDVIVITVGMLRYTTARLYMYGLIFAGYTISSLPLALLFLFSTRLFLKGLTSGALKA
jgi:multiple sugar transport system permease protein/raffinose/stachyose/melibiose transport system permease protein